MKRSGSTYIEDTHDVGADKSTNLVVGLDDLSFIYEETQWKKYSAQYNTSTGAFTTGTSTDIDDINVTAT